jgi:hypothetical protein
MMAYSYRRQLTRMVLLLVIAFVPTPVQADQDVAPATPPLSPDRIASTLQVEVDSLFVAFQACSGVDVTRFIGRTATTPFDSFVIDHFDGAIVRMALAYAQRPTAGHLLPYLVWLQTQPAYFRFDGPPRLKGTGIRGGITRFADAASQSSPKWVEAQPDSFTVSDDAQQRIAAVACQTRTSQEGLQIARDVSTRIDQMVSGNGDESADERMYLSALATDPSQVIQVADALAYNHGNDGYRPAAVQAFVRRAQHWLDDPELQRTGSLFAFVLGF